MPVARAAATLICNFCCLRLAITLVTVGAAAALSVRHATTRWSRLGTFARRAPYFSSVLIIAVGLYVGYHGWAVSVGSITASVPARAEPPSRL